MSDQSTTRASLYKSFTRTSGMLRLPGVRRPENRFKRPAPGARPGIEGIKVDASAPVPIRISYIDYGPSKVEAKQAGSLDKYFKTNREQWAAVRWVNVDGLDAATVKMFCKEYNLHTLAGEDVLHVPQRPKFESFDNHVFIVARMLRKIEGKLVAEQVSFFLFQDMLITFQESQGDVWGAVRERLELTGSRLRENGPDYLLYALLDAVVDHAFPILEQYGDQLEDLEKKVAGSPDVKVMHEIHQIKRELVMLRRVIWPMREVINELHHDEGKILSPNTQTYMRDVYDHAVQQIEVIETYRDMSAGIMDLYMSAVSNRMNDVMKVLTIMASFFIPITFLAGVYGMNFEHIPELRWEHSYKIFWVLCIATVLSLYIFFRRKGWIGKEG